jgi:hypothetical protein
MTCNTSILSSLKINSGLRLGATSRPSFSLLCMLSWIRPIWLSWWAQCDHVWLPIWTTTKSAAPTAKGQRCPLHPRCHPHPLTWIVEKESRGVCKEITRRWKLSPRLYFPSFPPIIMLKEGVPVCVHLFWHPINLYLSFLVDLHQIIAANLELNQNDVLIVQSIRSQAQLFVHMVNMGPVDQCGKIPDGSNSSFEHYLNIMISKSFCPPDACTGKVTEGNGHWWKPQNAAYINVHVQ